MKKLIAVIAIVAMSAATTFAANVTGTYKYKEDGAKGTLTVKPSKSKGKVDVEIVTIIGQNDCGLNGTAVG